MSRARIMMLIVLTTLFFALLEVAGRMAWSKWVLGD